MNPEIIDEIIDALLPSQDAGTQASALIACLKEQGIVTEQQLAPYLEQAANASEIKANGKRLRLKRILTSAISDLEHTKEKQDEVAKKKEDPEKAEEKSAARPTAKEDDDSQRTKAEEKPASKRDEGGRETKEESPVVKLMQKADTTEKETASPKKQPESESGAEGTPQEKQQR